MFRSYIRHREEQLAAEDDENKLFTPCQWGLGLLQDKHDGKQSYEILLDYVMKQLASSDEFFKPTEHPVYSFSSDGILTFPSEIKTESEENNVVRCRVFTSSSETRAIVILPHWNASPEPYDRLAQIVSWSGITAIRMTLPYHTERMPPGMKIADFMVSANLGRTILSTRQAVLDTRLVIAWLEQKGYQSIGILGSSLGSCIATLVAAHESRVRAAAFLLMASDFGEAVWTGRATKHIRKALEGQITLEQLKRVWSILSPITYVAKLKERAISTLILSGREDQVFEPYLTQQIVRAFEKEGIYCSWKISSCGHYTLGTFPFNIWAIFSAIRFFNHWL